MTAADLDRCTDFLRAIVDAPGVALPRLILADWLEENGHWRAAAGQRWAAREGKWPGIIGWCRSGWNPTNTELPDVFYDDFNNIEILGSIDQLDCELAYLSRCGQLDWPDGEPARPAEVVA